MFLLDKAYTSNYNVRCPLLFHNRFGLLKNRHITRFNTAIFSNLKSSFQSRSPLMQWGRYKMFEVFSPHALPTLSKLHVGHYINLNMFNVIKL